MPRKGSPQHMPGQTESTVTHNWIHPVNSTGGAGTGPREHGSVAYRPAVPKSLRAKKRAL